MERLAAESGTASAVVYNLERGRRNSSREMVLRLATALGVNPAPGLAAAGFLPAGYEAVVPGEIERTPYSEELAESGWDDKMTDSARQEILDYIRFKRQQQRGSAA